MVHSALRTQAHACGRRTHDRLFLTARTTPGARPQGLRFQSG